MKRMRLIALCLSLMTSVLSFAQITSLKTPEKASHPLSSDELDMFLNKNATKFNKKATVNAWYDYITVLRDNGETFVYFGDVYLWPDSMPVINYQTTGLNNVFIHSIGEVFDPKSFYFIDPTPQFSKFTTYTIDSIAFFYKYLNLNGIADTLLVQYYGADKIANLVFNGTVQTKSVVLNKSTSSGSDATGSFKIPLDMTNNTPDFFAQGSDKFSGLVEFATPLSIPADGLGAYTVTFMPGNYPYALGDTLAYEDSVNLPAKKLNAFVPLVLRGDGAASGLDNSMNHGILCYSNQKYSTRSPEWYYPANAPGSQKQFLRSFFKISSQNLSAANIRNGYALGKAYPNPAKANEEISIDFALGNAGEVSIVLYDVVGKEVMTLAKGSYAQGEHTITASLNNIPKGVYIYQIKSGSYSASHKLNVH